MSPITNVTSLSQLNTILSKSKEKLTVIDFHATWCGPCHAIAPAFEALSRQYTTVNFLKCDVDAAADVSGAYSISAMPTFIFLKGSTKIDQVRGANKSALESMLKKYSTSSTAAFSGQGQTLGGDPAAPDVVGEVKGSLDSLVARFSALDPQAKVLLGLLGLYVVFWFF
jgi:thioredoxin 1